MDPNALLAQIRELSARLRHHEAMGTDAEPEMGFELAHCISALDIWLSSGGFKPDSWKD